MISLFKNITQHTQIMLWEENTGLNKKQYCFGEEMTNVIEKNKLDRVEKILLSWEINESSIAFSLTDTTQWFKTHHSFSNT